MIGAVLGICIFEVGPDKKCRYSCGIVVLQYDSTETTVEACVYLEDFIQIAKDHCFLFPTKRLISAHDEIKAGSSTMHKKEKKDIYIYKGDSVCVCVCMCVCV